jgi:hypothetical protein
VCHASHGAAADWLQEIGVQQFDFEGFGIFAFLPSCSRSTSYVV